MGTELLERQHSRGGSTRVALAWASYKAVPAKPKVACMMEIEISPVADEVEEQLSLDAYLETWPHESFGLPEVQAFKAGLLDHADLLARQDGVVLGCGFAALFPGLPKSPRVMITVPPGKRCR